MPKHTNKKDKDKKETGEVFGNPVYGPGEDIYAKGSKISLEEEEEKRDKGNADELPGQDLDIPGAELDDADEMIGEEDEENNYYSLGGDNHEDLEEHRD